LTSTATTSEHAGVRGHAMTVLGLARGEGVVYVVEDIGDGDAPIAYRMYLTGERTGHLVPIHAWYERSDDAADIHARIAELAPRLEPLARTTTEAFMLSTRIVQRRALRVAEQDLPIRKFALQLRVEAVSGHGPSGHTTVTAFLRPHAELAEVWALPDGGALARVTFCGIPSGLGARKDTVVLLGA
jgi:hypothetical protein